MTTRNHACAVLCLSCDRYRDLWPVATKLFVRFWPDCPWPRYLGSDTLPPLLHGFTPLAGSGANLNWSALLTSLLLQIPEETILLFLDDFFLTSPADTSAAEMLLSKMEGLNAVHLRLVPHRQYLSAVDNLQSVGYHAPGLPYRACLQAGFWKRDTLLQLLRDGESPWEFEVAATRRSEYLTAPFLAALRNPVPYIDVLERGKWLPRGIRLCRREGIEIDTSVRPGISLRDRVRRLASRIAAGMINRIPHDIRIALRRRRQPREASRPC